MIMFYNAPLFSIKPIFYIKFIDSILLIPLIIQQQLAPLMFKIVILLKLIDIIDNLWPPF